MNTCCVKSVSLAKPKIILRIVIIAVKKNKKLYFKSSLSSPWGHVANSGSVGFLQVSSMFIDMLFIKLKNQMVAALRQFYALY